MTRTYPWLLSTLLALGPSLLAQGGTAKAASATKFDPAKLEKDDKEVAVKCAAILMRFGDYCKSQKLAPRAKESYDRIINFYDPDHNGARMALGFKKTKDGWQEAKPPLQWKDKSTDELRFKVQTEWLAASKGLAKQHRERGLKLMADGSNDIALGAYHLRCAIAYDPMDRESHLALGHEEWKAPEGISYYGPPEDIAFMKKMREVETTALSFAKKEYEVTPVTDLPEELKNLGLEMHGARSKHFTAFTRGTQENADNIVKWGERALDFMETVIGAPAMKKLQVRERQARFAFRAYLWTSAEKKDFIEKNPQIFKTKEDIERTKQFGNINWVRDNRICEVSQKLTPAGMHDHMVANVWQYAFLGMNDALKEGIMHAAGWYLLATTETRFGALPDKSETTSGPELNLPHSTTWWLREMRDQAVGATDFAANSLPRVALSKFPNDARMKSWSFMTWLFARFPDKWLEFATKVPADKKPFPEEIDKLAEAVFGKPLVEIEAEWREWAAGRGVTAAGTGYGPPLIPEKPNSHEIGALKQVNKLRKIAKLDECEIDSEASYACDAHAKFLAEHPEHLKWPDAHEEDPAKSGFTPRGMRCGMQSVILWGTTDAADSVDGWMGTFYHRLPLLEPNTRRIGMAVVEAERGICVLDFGSLQDPYDPDKSPKWIHWPIKDMKDVPVQFHGHEWPNPVEEVAPKDKQDTTALGYPITIQFSKGIATQITEATIQVFEIKRSTKFDPEKERDIPREAKEVPCYTHTPIVPMLKRMEFKDCMCAIPKEHLKANTPYIARCSFRTGETVHEVVTWKFTTGQ